jgi:hypothetical protein
MRTIRILAAAIFAAVMTMTMILVGSSNASTPKPVPPAPTAVSSGAGQSFSTMAEAEKFWTPAKMAAAVPVEPKVKPGKTSVPSVAPVLSSVRTDIHAVAGSLRPAPMETLRDPVTRPYTNGVERLNGKVFFTQNGGNYVCSGTVVNSESKDLVDTAGHCVNDGAQHWSTNWVFVPGYNSSAANPYPYGIWSTRNLTTTWEWHLNRNFKQDLGYAVLKPLNGRHIVNYLGGQGSYFNVTRTQTFDAFGYPQAAPYNGLYMRLAVSASSGVGDNPYTGWPGPNAMRINSEMTGGSSGGGWIIAPSRTTGLGHVNGHNDYKYNSDPNHMYSPYYGPEALNLFTFARRLQ